jgi:DNA ligase (NAD+)
VSQPASIAGHRPAFGSERRAQGEPINRNNVSKRNSTMIPKQRMDELVARLNEANAKYRLGEYSGMADRDFDARLKELHELEKRHPIFMRDDSPTRRIGVEPLTGLTRARHSEPMLSIENAYTYQEIEKFLDQTDAEDYTLEHKVDGVALSLIYENGHLVQALTRGDGVEGDDVTHNAKTIQDIPHVLRRVGSCSWSPPERFEIRGEVYMPKAAFDRWNAAGHYKNPRNAAAGAIRLLNPAECAKRPLRCLVSLIFCFSRERKNGFNLQQVILLDKLCCKSILIVYPVLSSTFAKLWCLCELCEHEFSDVGVDESRHLVSRQGV